MYIEGKYSQIHLVLNLKYGKCGQTGLEINQLCHPSSPPVSQEALAEHFMLFDRDTTAWSLAIYISIFVCIFWIEQFLHCLGIIITKFWETHQTFCFVSGVVTMVWAMVMGVNIVCGVVTMISVVISIWFVNWLLWFPGWSLLFACFLSL